MRERCEKARLYQRRVSGTELAKRVMRESKKMSVVKLLGFGTMPCGCVVGRYRDVASMREVVYVEEKGPQCASASHRQNHTITALRDGRTADGFQPALVASRAS